MDTSIGIGFLNRQKSATQLRSKSYTGVIPANKKEAVTAWHKFCSEVIAAEISPPWSNSNLHPLSMGLNKMEELTLIPSASNEDDQCATAFYRQVLEVLNSADASFLVGGAYAFNCYSGITRHTKDLDIFICRQDYGQVSEALMQAGYETELTYPHWLGKVASQGEFVDIIFSSGNGIAEVDDAWFDHAAEAEVLGVRTKICPVEEMIWSKAFIMEKERFDGADIVHLLQARGSQLDWPRLLRRFDSHWRILLSHLVLFGFVYPGHRDLVPSWVMDELLEHLRHETHAPPSENGICFGTLLSREQYLMDIEQWGCQDARLVPVGNMTAKDTAIWTEAIQDKHQSS